jgi:hypothetical protein
MKGTIGEDSSSSRGRGCSHHICLAIVLVVGMALIIANFFSFCHLGKTKNEQKSRWAIEVPLAATNRTDPHESLLMTSFLGSCFSHQFSKISLDH